MSCLTDSNLSFISSNLYEVKEHAEIALQTTKKWQLENAYRDKLIRQKITKQSEHIRTLLEDRKIMISKLNEMHRDIIILNSNRDQYEQMLQGADDSINNTPSGSGQSSNLFIPFLESYTKSSRITRYNSDPELSDVRDDGIRGIVSGLI